MTRPLVLFTDETDLDPAPGRALLERAGCDTMLADLPSTAAAERALPAGAERAVALVVGYARIDAELLDRLPNVGFIATMSAGFDMIDRTAAEARGIWIVNLTDAATEEVAAHALTLMLALERDLRGSLAVTAAGGWTDDVTAVPRRLSGLTLGLFGFGRIAQRLAQVAAPSFARVIAHDPFVTAPVHGVELVDRDTLIGAADVLSLHLPLTADTHGAIGAQTFAAMRPGSSLVNVSRGELVDPAALAAALDSGAIRGAAVDVLHGEPPAADHPLRRDPRVLVTPHVAFLSDGSLEHYTLDPARNVLSWLRTGAAARAAVTGRETTPLLPAAH
ncbi:C-terminal binding protein [Leucobacter sp. G161]|uniref:C-terminal binding protein n=1 Tax=Leucobacter sp. G161 TaxID=663704 RepID=UPI00073B6A72|nr:C-terminal binding protein [Leucobacter sp. G161]KUF05759.1 dehydrogenase [Leucobacter sp. G161]